MFELQNISVRNFMSLSALDLDFDNDSITLICGENGSGKSSLLYSLAFTIFNYKKADAYKDFIKAGSDEATIHLEAMFKGYPIVYDVEIKSTVTRDVTYKGVTYHNSDYEQFMEDEGLTDIQNIMFIMNNGTSLVDMKPTERANTLKSLFKIDFSSQVESLKDKIDTSKLEIAKMKSSVDELSAINLDLIPLKRPKSQASIDAEKEELRRLGESLRELDGISENSIKENESAMDRKSNAINDTENRISTLKAQIERAERQLSEAERKVSEHPVEDLEEDLAEAQKRLDDHHTQWQKDRMVYSDLDKKLYSAERSVSEIDEQIETGRQGFCHACGQPVDESHIKKLESERKEMVDDVEDIKRHIKELGFDLSDKESQPLKDELNEIREELNDVKRAVDDARTYRERVSDYRSQKKDKEELLESYWRDLEALQNEHKRLDGLTSQLEHKNELQAQYDALEKQIESDVQSLGAFREQKEQNERIREKRTQRDERVQKLSESINELTIESNLNKTCVEILDKALPTYMLLKACSTLEEYINGVVGKLFPYLKVKLQSKGKGVEFYILTESSEDKWVSAKLASGAQKAILNLSFSVAIAQIYGVRTILLDEVDASMNGKNSRLVYEFLSTIEGFDQVVFVSNRQESLEVAKENGATCYFVDHGEYELM